MIQGLPAPLSSPNEAIAPEASLPLRGHRRPAFFERVSQLLKDADVLIPARVLEACRQAQGEFLIGGPRHVRLELRNVVAKYPFESSHRFPRIQPNSGHRDDFAVELRPWPDAARV
jgi:hypothetical protein